MADRPAYPGTPRWVKVSGIVVLVLVLLAVVIMVTGVGGQHGPWRHTGAADTPLSAVTAQAGSGAVADPASSGGPGGHALHLRHPL